MQQEFPPSNPDDVHQNMENSDDEDDDNSDVIVTNKLSFFKSLFTTKMDPVFQEELLKVTQEKKLVFLRIFLSFFAALEGFSLKNVLNLKNLQSELQRYLHLSLAILLVSLCGLLVISKVRQNLKLVYPCVSLSLLFRLIIIFDLETLQNNIRIYGEMGHYVNKPSVFLCMQIFFNMIFPKKISIPVSFLSICDGLICQLYQFRYNFDSGTFDLPPNIKKLVLKTFIQQTCFLAFIGGILRAAELEIIQAWNLRNMAHQELTEILDNLEEAIITKNSEKRIGLCNEPGSKILWKIQYSSKQKSNLSSNIENQSQFQGNKLDQVEERRTLRSRVFKLFEDKKEVPTRTNESASENMQVEIPETLYSLNQIFKWDIKELSTKIFTIHFAEKSENGPQRNYYQIKRQKIWNGKKTILQIIDISNQILINRANGEKKLLSIINATVSHEMRNPLNSIYSQNLKQSQISEKIKEILDTDLSMKKMKKVLKTLRKEQLDSIKIQSSSTKLLTFLVNDMLDFAQLRSGKFRKDLFNFDIREAIEEIVNLQMLKAEYSGINLTFEMNKFPIRLGFNKIISSSKINPKNIDYVICSDQQRIQQVVLNLLSNALKFTPSGGIVKIIVTNIESQSDLIHEEHKKYFINSKGHGMIEISVQDSGVGIKKEDQDKLFKLFGFLDASKELNAKGVGLGLHISQRITQQFGGKIILESQPNEGSSFTFLIDLDKKSDYQNKVRRILNPQKKTYQKIILPDDKPQKNKSIESLKKMINNKSIQIIKEESEEEDGNEKTQFPKKQVTFALCPNNYEEQHNDDLNSQREHKIEFFSCQRDPKIGHSFPLPLKTQKINDDEDILYTDLDLPQAPFLCQQCALDYLDSDSSSDSQNSSSSLPFSRKISLDNPIDLSCDFPVPRRHFTTTMDSVTLIPKRILIVDDEPYNLVGLKIVIEAANKKTLKGLIDEAKNGEEAVKMVKKAYSERKYQYGLIFMDCSMPVMDGYEATDKIRKFIKSHYYQQPMIVACTGHSEDEYVKKAWRHQMDEVVPKPANIEVIRCILNQIIQYQK